MPKHIIKTLSVGRVFNLGHYETLRYGVEIEVSPEADPGQLLKELEELLEQLRPVPWTDELRLAHEYWAATKVGGAPANDETSAYYAQLLTNYQEAQVRVEAARKKLSSLGGELTEKVPPQ